MSTPERRGARSGLARRNFEPQQHSPFHRAYYDSHSPDRFDASHVLNTAGARRRRNLSQSNTLRGAFETVSRYPTMSEEISTTPYSLGTPNRRKQSFTHMSPESNPPNELAETYRQINDAGSLVDQDIEDVRSPVNRMRSTQSPSHSRTPWNDVFSNDDVDFLNEVTEESSPRKLADRARDEERLKRATASRSPVLSKVGATAALTSENLQRREEEDQAVFEEEENHHGPSLNVPLNWGRRGTHRRDWLRNITKRAESESGRTEEARQEPSPPSSKSTARPYTNLEIWPTGGERRTLAERVNNKYNKAPLSDALNGASPEKSENLDKGDQIPNTPIMVIKNSTFSKRSPTKRDSHDLLRRLSRTESPNQNQNQTELRTPENSKVPERRIYDKTPVVTGAWIDTPLTERMSEIPKPRLNNFKPVTNGDRDTGFLGSAIQRIPEEPKSSEASQDKGKATDYGVQKETEKPREPEKTAPKTEYTTTDKQKTTNGVKETTNNNTKPEHQTEQEKPKEKKQRPPLVKPDLPKSALETVMQDFKADKGSLDVGDDTLESLQQILDEKADEKANNIKTEAEVDAEYEKSVVQKLELASSGSKDAVDLDKLNQKLNSLADNISKVKKGLNGLEDQVIRDAATLASIPHSKSPSSNDDDPCHNCQTCKAYHNGSACAIYYLRLWKRHPVSRRFRPTLLGWSLAIFTLWYFSESTMCDYYCHPFIADVCDRNCLLPDAPRFPFVIPTMLYRWLHLSTIITPLWTLLIASYRLITQLLGLRDGYVDDSPPPTLNLTGQIRIRGTVYDTFPGLATPTLKGLFGHWKHTPHQTPVPELHVEPQVHEKVINWADDSMDDDELI
ncbi:hypothetical protein BDV25DRAFT_57420 [Aspergillus avenaceus]|uniref:Uncharacterized protein n=1 Tax=Aspergillus avenaceus TaxID=36643 RepID=A0A5N6U2P5_ASPAV|nr:hypothetical protein BDV25DRAFT_57420 [Aspergillus avenaceus]